MHLLSLGDQGVSAYFEDEAAALSFAAAVRRMSPGWLVDVVQAYASVAVYYDVCFTHYHEVATWLTALSIKPGQEIAGRLHQIPCCYERQMDLGRVARHKGLSAEETIGLHLATEYTVYAIGFCPGFPYLGYLPPALTGVPRLDQPRLRVEAGSVGLTGRQTGIYTEVRPGGWNLIGQTPLQLVDVADGYFPLRVGDRVQFVRIDEKEYWELRGERL
jgi:inhibitor of KinA